MSQCVSISRYIFSRVAISLIRDIIDISLFTLNSESDDKLPKTIILPSEPRRVPTHIPNLKWFIYGEEENLVIICPLEWKTCSGAPFNIGLDYFFQRTGYRFDFAITALNGKLWVTGGYIFFEDPYKATYFMDELGNWEYGPMLPQGDG